MSNKELIQLIASIAEVDSDSLNEETSLAEIEWDSLMDLSFIAAIDKNAGITVSAQGLASCKTVADLIALIIN